MVSVTLQLWHFLLLGRHIHCVELWYGICNVTVLTFLTTWSTHSLCRTLVWYLSRYSYNTSYYLVDTSFVQTLFVYFTVIWHELELFIIYISDHGRFMHWHCNYSYNTSYSLVDTSIVYNCGMVSVTTVITLLTTWSTHLLCRTVVWYLSRYSYNTSYY